MKQIHYDERTLKTSARVSQVMLSLTQLALAGAVLYRALVLNQPGNQYADFQIILAFSMLGNLFGMLYLGGYLPALSVGHMLKLYLAGVTLLLITLTIGFGVPELNEWHNTILPVLVGPALILVLYYFVARMGQRRTERLIEDE
ncbi:hypothetical protein ACFLYP_02215 [Chloroflexota bacterium]